MDLKLKDKNAIVTGGNKGIGKGIAMALAKEGCNVSICARTENDLKAAAGELKETGSEILTVRADLTKEEDIEKVVSRTSETFGSIDILINNAGSIGKSGTFEDTPLHE